LPTVARSGFSLGGIGAAFGPIAVTTLALLGLRAMIAAPSPIFMTATIAGFLL